MKAFLVLFAACGGAPKLPTAPSGPTDDLPGPSGPTHVYEATADGCVVTLSGDATGSTDCTSVMSAKSKSLSFGSGLTIAGGKLTIDISWPGNIAVGTYTAPS